MTRGWGWWGDRDPTPAQRSRRSQTRPRGWRAGTSGPLPAETPESCLQTESSTLWSLPPSGTPWVQSVAPSQTHPACTSSASPAPRARLVPNAGNGARPAPGWAQSPGTFPRFPSADFSTRVARTASARCHQAADPTPHHSPSAVRGFVGWGLGVHKGGPWGQQGTAHGVAAPSDTMGGVHTGWTVSPQNEHRQCHHGMGAANVTPAWGQMVSPQHRDNQCLAWAPSLPPHTRAEPSQHRLVPYLGEQRGTLQRGLHQLVQGKEEALQGALELSHLLPLVEPAMARVTVLSPRCHHTTHLPQHCQPLLGGCLPSQLITLVHECLDPWLDLVVSPNTITVLAEPQPWHSHSLGTVTAPPCPQTHSQKLFFLKKKKPLFHDFAAQTPLRAVQHHPT